MKKAHFLNPSGEYRNYFPSMKNLTLTFLPLSILMACSSGDTNIDPVATADPLSAEPILWQQNLQYQLAETPEYLHIVRDTMDCRASQSVQDTLQSFVWKREDGTLLLWDTLQCQAVLLGGGYATLDGAWEYRKVVELSETDWEERKNPNCTAVDSTIWPAQKLVIDNGKATWQREIAEYCMLEQEPIFQALQEKGLATYSLDVQDCQSFRVLGDSGEGDLRVTAFDPTSQSYTVEYQFQNTSCTYHHPGNATCSDEASAFNLCILGIGL